MHIRNPKPLLPRSASNIEGRRQMSFFYFIIMIDKTIDVGFAIVRIPLGTELVGMPSEIDIQRWYEERSGRRRNQVQECVISSYAMM